MVFIPLLFPGLTFSEIIIFEVIQTLICMVLSLAFMYCTLLLFMKERKEIDIKKIISTNLFVEMGNLIIAFMEYVFFDLVFVGLVTMLLFMFIVPLGIIYLRYYEKSNFNEVKVIILYLLGYIVALLLSMTLTSMILNIFGIDNYLIFSF